MSSKACTALAWKLRCAWDTSLLLLLLAVSKALLTVPAQAYIAGALAISTAPSKAGGLWMRLAELKLGTSNIGTALQPAPVLLAGVFPHLRGLLRLALLSVLPRLYSFVRGLLSGYLGLLIICWHAVSHSCHPCIANPGCYAACDRKN